MERRDFNSLHSGSLTDRNGDTRGRALFEGRTMTANPDQANWCRKQAIAKALNLSSKNGPSHTNPFDF